MAKIVWDFIRPLDQTSAIANMASGNQQINAGLQAMGGAVTGYADAMKQRNTDDIMNALYQAQTSADLPQAMQAVQALQQQYGRGYDQNAVRSAIDTRGSTLGQRDLQNINLQQAQAAQAAIPQLNQAAIAQAKARGVDTTAMEALTGLGIDTTGQINTYANNSISDTRDARDYKDKRDDITYNRNYQIRRDKVTDANNQRDYNFRVDESNWNRSGDISKENPASSGYATDENGNLVTVTNSGISRMDAYGALSGYVNKVVGAESGGNNRAQNTQTSAGGAGQFIDSTWVSMLRKYKPELARGKTDRQLIGMKYDGDLSREMTAAYGKENAEGLRKAGFQPTDGNLYLAHFAGLGGARSLLKANPNASAESILGKDAADKNGTIIRGKTVGQVINWAYNNVNKQSSNSSKASNAIGPSVSQANMSKVTSQYQDSLAKLESDFGVQSAKDQVKGSVATTGKNVDTWAAGKKDSGLVFSSNNSFFTKAGDLANMAKKDPAFNKLPESAQINVLEGAYAKMNNVNAFQYVPDGDLKKFISTESQNYQKDRINQHEQAKNAVFEQAYQGVVQQFQAVGSKPPSPESVRQMLDPQYKAPTPKPVAQAEPQAKSNVSTNVSVRKEVPAYLSNERNKREYALAQGRERASNVANMPTKDELARMKAKAQAQANSAKQKEEARKAFEKLEEEKRKKKMSPETRALINKFGGGILK